MSLYQNYVKMCFIAHIALFLPKRHSAGFRQIKLSFLENILQIDGVGKTYSSADRTLAVLSDINFAIARGASMSIVGPSGSGKTTLLGICAGLDAPTSGRVILNNEVINDLTENQRARLRNRDVGFVFQNFQLLPTLTALENVMVPLELRGEKNIRQRAVDLLAKVGLAQRINHYPSQLSGGEQQRVSLARAFSNEPKILFADEPTGNLDDDTAATVIELIFQLNREAGTTLVLVTHDSELAAMTNRILRLRGGKIVEDSIPGTSLHEFSNTSKV